MSLVLAERVFRAGWVDVHPVKLDFAAILSDLKLAGLSGYRVAEMIGAEWSTVQRWQHGAEPRYSYGVALMVLHAYYCSPKATQKRQTEGRLGM